MKFHTKVFTLLFLFIFPAGIFHVFAQLPGASKKDTSTILVDSSRFFSFYENGFPYGNIGDELLLTNQLANFQNFKSREASTGNAGAPEKQLILNPSTNSVFHRSQNGFSHFGFQPENKKFFDSERPYTSIQFIVGQKQELNVSVIHAHPFGKNCNIAFGFDRIRSTGFYQRQSTNNTCVNLNGWYRSPGRRYALLSDIYWTGIDVEENGGITNDSDFEFSNQLDRHVVSVNLTGAETQQRFRGIWIKQYWSFGNALDTISGPKDSLHLKTRISPSWAFVHTVHLSDEKYIYSDLNPTSGFYSTIFSDSTQTKDSTFLWKLENGLWLERFELQGLRMRKFSGKLGVKQELGELFNDTIYRHFINYLADGNLKFERLGSIGWKRFIPDEFLNGWMVLNGDNKGDYFIRGRIAERFLKFNVLEITAEQKRQHPDFLFSHFSGNHFAWVNDFYSSTQTDLLATGLKYFGKINLLEITFGTHNYFQPIYFDENKLPTQYSGSINAISGRIYLLFGSKMLRTSTDITWNNLPSNSPIRLPEFILRESVYGDFHLFKKALQLQVGVDGIWFSAYYADAYNPNISQFFVQNSKKIGNYILLDPWVSIKVRSVRIFVKADHINAAFMGRNYYQIPHYPLNDFALKFGLSWVFND